VLCSDKAGGGVFFARRLDDAPEGARFIGDVVSARGEIVDVRDGYASTISAGPWVSERMPWRRCCSSGGCGFSGDDSVDDDAFAASCSATAAYSRSISISFRMRSSSITLSFAVYMLTFAIDDFLDDLPVMFSQPCLIFGDAQNLLGDTGLGSKSFVELGVFENGFGLRPVRPSPVRPLVGFIISMPRDPGDLCNARLRFPTIKIDVAMTMVTTRYAPNIATSS